MSEYKTLDQWFPNGRGDGRKFLTRESEQSKWFEPVFKGPIRNPCDPYTWHGLDSTGFCTHYSEKTVFKEYTAPKKTKKVTMYKPVFWSLNNNFYSPQDVQWHSDKDYYKGTFQDIKGWLSQEVEVQCD